MRETTPAPLSVKLGIKENTVLALVHAPSGFALLTPPGVEVKTSVRGHVDVVVAFFVRGSPLTRQLDARSRAIAPDGGLWIAWPTRSSGVATDVTDHVLRDVALPRGLVDNKVCAIDETWTALRFVWRSSRRRDRAAT